MACSRQRGARRRRAGRGGKTFHLSHIIGYR